MAEELIKRISNTSDYYKILALERDADESAIKKAYKKLALQLHPDKCSLPGAEDAFKKVSAAYNCLSQPDQRRVYDMTGSEPGAGGGGGFNGGFPGGVDPNEIFAQFFAQQGMNGGGGFPFGGGQGVRFGGPGGPTMFFSGGMPGGFGGGFPGGGFPGGAAGGIPLEELFGAFQRPGRRPGASPRSSPSNRGNAAESDGDSSAQLDAILGPVISIFRTVSSVVPAQLLVPLLAIIGVYFFSSIISVLMSRAYLTFPALYFAPSKYKFYILGGIVVLGMLGIL